MSFRLDLKLLQDILTPVNQDVEPYPGVPYIIKYVNGNNVESILSGVYHGANNDNPILPEKAQSKGVHIPHIPGAEDLQIPGLIPNTTYNT